MNDIPETKDAPMSRPINFPEDIDNEVDHLKELVRNTESLSLANYDRALRAEAALAEGIEGWKRITDPMLTFTLDRAEKAEAAEESAKKKGEQFMVERDEARRELAKARARLSRGGTPMTTEQTFRLLLEEFLRLYCAAPRDQQEPDSFFARVQDALAARPAPADVLECVVCGKRGGCEEHGSRADPSPAPAELFCPACKGNGVSPNEPEGCTDCWGTGKDSYARGGRADLRPEEKP